MFNDSGWEPDWDRRQRGILKWSIAMFRVGAFILTFFFCV